MTYTAPENEARYRNATQTMVMVVMSPKMRGKVQFCETCHRYMPNTKAKVKGWKCNECRSVGSKVEHKPGGAA